MTSDELHSLLNDMRSLANYSGTCWPLNARRPLMEAVGAMECLTAENERLEAELDAQDCAHSDEIAAHQETLVLWSTAKQRVAELERLLHIAALESP